MRNPVIAVLAVGFVVGGILICTGVVFLGGSLFYARRAVADRDEYAFIQEQVAVAPAAAPAPPAPQDLFKPVPDGMRAITLRIHPDVGVVDGLVLPAYVDIIGKAPQPDEPDKLVTQVIVQNVLVVRMSSSHELGKGMTSNVTAIVTPEDAIKLVDAAPNGPFSIIVRKPDSKRE